MINDQSLVETQINSQVGTIILNDVKTRNSLSLAMIESLLDAFEQLQNHHTIKIIVLKANGPVFSAGHNLKEINQHRVDQDKGKSFFKMLIERCSELMLTIIKYPIPVIAMIQGMATAAGCQLIASCDLAIAVNSAKFATPGVNIGLFCSTPMVALTRNVLSKHAMEMLLTGEAIDAETAEKIGLINKAVENLEEATNELISKIISKPKPVIKMGKKAFYQQMNLSIDDAYQHVGAIMIENLLHGDCIEGVNAFIEKRSPRWPDSD